jgi:hypothetical protein
MLERVPFFIIILWLRPISRIMTIIFQIPIAVKAICKVRIEYFSTHLFWSTQDYQKYITILSSTCAELNTCNLFITYFDLINHLNIIRYFDIDSKTGATFLLVDSLQTGVISLMGIGKDRNDAIKIMNKAMQFIINLVGNS